MPPAVVEPSENSVRFVVLFLIQARPEKARAAGAFWLLHTIAAGNPSSPLMTQKKPLTYVDDVSPVSMFALFDLAEARDVPDAEIFST